MASVHRVRISSLFVLAAVSVLSYTNAEDLVISKVERKIDLQAHSIRISVNLKVENKGSEQPIKSLDFLLPKFQSENLSFIKIISIEGKQKNKKLLPLEIIEKKSSPKTETNTTQYEIRLRKPLAKDESLTVEIYYVITNAIRPFPAEIGQSEPQLLLYDDSHVFLSPYSVRSQSLTVRLPNKNVESFTKRSPSKQSELELKFGPYEKVKPFDFSPLTIHFESNLPLILAESLEREIEISHWGNIYVTENYRIRHVGAKHKGTFSRFEFQSAPMSTGVSSLRGLLALLPPHAHSVYYRDEIGNISTSRMRQDSKKTEIEIEPRYPLMGGWSTTFKIGYSLPLDDFLFHTKEGGRALNFTFGSSFTDIVVQELTVKIVLPEGSSNHQVQIPFHVEQFQEEKFTYLDTVGRPVIVLKKKNVVAEYGIQRFVVTYSFSSLSQLVEPLLLIFIFFLFFALCVCYVHFDFAISRHTPSHLAKVLEEEVQYAIQRLQTAMKSRLLSTQKIDDSLYSLSRNADVAKAKRVLGSAGNVLKKTGIDLKSIVGSLEAMQPSPSVLPKVKSLVAKEKERESEAYKKHEIFVESFEKKLSSKEIDEKISPIQQKFSSLSAEVKELLLAIGE